MVIILLSVEMLVFCRYNNYKVWCNTIVKRLERWIFMPKKLFKTGEFASFCNTTKDTLFHYDDIGLLKPVKVAFNGYRYYSPKQVFMFDLIATLKEVGLSLEEIREYIYRRDTDIFMEMLRQKDQELKKEIDLLIRRRRLLNNTLRITEKYKDAEEERIVIADTEEEYFIVSDKMKNNSEKELYSVLASHLQYCSEHNCYDDFSTGEIIGYENIMNGSFNSTYYSSRIDRKRKSRYLHIKPAGRYAVKYVRSSYSGLRDEYKRFYREITGRGLKCAGNIYQNDILSYFSEREEDDYLMKLEMQVE